MTILRIEEKRGELKMIINEYEIRVVCSNNTNGDNWFARDYGDIYESYEDCRKEHPHDRIIYGFSVQDKATPPRYNNLDWVDTLDEALEWINNRLC